jgi:2,4-dienoyl-CoA reductase-like NADH-dependent reductase (Old Yellow Enzyme family)/thioredoxin reductase
VSNVDALLRPFKLRHLTLRNRVASTGHAAGLAEGGMPKDRYQLYHAEKARGGIGLTIFGGSSSVAPDSPLPFAQIDISSDRVLPYLHSFGERVHQHGAAIFCQITHLGRRGHWANHNWLPLIAPSVTREQAHRSYAKEMEDWDFTRTIAAFANAAYRCKQSGLDGVEVIAAAHHLIDSFLSPITNKRTDKYGGSLENRARFGLEVFRAIRDRVGDKFVLGLRMAGDELIEGGLDATECLRIATIFGSSGLIDYISVYQAQGDNFAQLSKMLPDMSLPSAPFLYLASAIKAELDIPILHASAIRDIVTANRAVAEGHVDLVAMTRAHIADPHIVRKIREGRQDSIRQCVGANYCGDFAGQGGVKCVQNAATGNESWIPHTHPKAQRRRKVVVVGGGPGGLEAARVGAERGHDVVLFEAASRLGGQIALAQNVPWRTNLSGVVRWLENQVRRSGVEIRLETRADAQATLTEQPDIVIIATGGTPASPRIAGAELTVSSWRILDGSVTPGSNVLIYDEMGLHTGVGCADFMAQRGASVELVTPDRAVGEEVGHLTYVAYLRKLYEGKTVQTPNMRLSGAYAEGNSVIAVLRNEYTGSEEERAVDQIVYEMGTVPNDDLYHTLRPHSVNLGEVDYDALIGNEQQVVQTNPAGIFQLFRIGDAVIGRNIYAAILDASRFMKDL